ncbi:hypothetical protein V8G54_018198, partial [Vigna mungo]
EKLDTFRRLIGKGDGDPLRIVSVGAGAWGSVFAALLQDSYGQFRDKIQIRIWRRAGRAVDRGTAEHLFEVINSREDVLRRWSQTCRKLFGMLILWSMVCLLQKHVRSLKRLVSIGRRGSQCL